MSAALTKRIARHAATVTLLGALLACSGPPFNAYDPPPTFAFRYVLTDPRVGGALWSGSLLHWNWSFDIISPTYENRGNTRVYDRNAIFTYWYVVDNGRWPSGWRVFAEAGACAGTQDIARVERKLVEIQCAPATRPLQVLPGTYQSGAPPGSLTVQFDGSVAAGTGVAIWIVNADAGTLISGPTQDAVNGAGQAAVPAPGVSEGHYTVVVEFSDQSNPATGGFDVVAGCHPQDVWVDDHCTGTHQVCWDVTVTVDEWCPTTRPVCDRSTDWVPDYCTSSTYLCDTASQWVDDWCQDSYWTCDYQTLCEGSCDEWGCWESCWNEAYNCREESYSYVCGGHEESYQYNCRWEDSTYVCGGHWEDFFYNCREEEYSYLCGSHEETHQDCRDEPYDYVCGGHWETRQICS